MGRVENVIEEHLGWYTKEICYTYDLQGNVIQKDLLDPDSRNNDFHTTYTYDKAGRMSVVKTKHDPESYVQEGSYQYYASGKVKRLQLANAQGVDYVYNERDWLQMINHQNLGNVYNYVPQDPGRDGFDSGIPVDKFGEVIGYTDSTNIGLAQHSYKQYSGNISWLMYNMSGVNYTGPNGTSALVGYSFTYDKANRLTAGDFGYYTNNWYTTNAYDEKNITYDNSGNLTSLYRYDNDGNSNDELGYYYVSGKNRLDHIADGYEESNYYYTYDDNGNVTSDNYRNIVFVIYDSDNLPVRIYKSNGENQFYTYDINGNRTRKTITGGTDRYYFNGIDSKTEAVCLLPYSSDLTYNILGNNDNIGQVKVVNNSVTGRYYYLKDHLGSIKMTVNGGQTLLSDNFSNDLSKWTLGQGSGFFISNGELANLSAGDNYLVNSGTTTYGNVSINVNVKTLSSNADPSIIARYQDANNFYLISPNGSTITIYERLNGAYNTRATGNLPSAIVQNTSYALRIDLSGGQINVSWNNQPIVSWTDTSPWTSGKVGFRQCSSRNVRWDNFYVWSSGNGSVAGYDDYYPYGSIMPNRSSVQSADARYKFTSKERDTETGWDYFGKRLYDSFTGSFPQCDPLADLYPGVSPYVYCLDNPINIIDPKGLYTYTINGVEINQDLAQNLIEDWNYGEKKKQKDEHSNKTKVEIGYITSGASGEKHAILILNIKGKPITIEGMPTDRDLGILMTILLFLRGPGAGTMAAMENITHGGAGWGNLIKEQVTKAETIKDKQIIEPPSGITTEDFQNKLIEISAQYFNNRQYAPLPKDNAANSNSLIGSILRKAGSDFKPDKDVPGWEQDIFK